MRRIGRNGRGLCGPGVAVLILAWVLPVVSWGEEVSIKAGVRQNTVTVGSELALTVVVTGSGIRSVPDPVLPELTGAALYSAGRSTSLSTSIVNGRFATTHSVTHNYVIIPEQEGTLVIGPITVTHKGEAKRTAPITVEVIPAGKAYTHQPPASKRQAPIAEAEGKDLFVELSMDKQEGYVNEQLILTFRFYTRVNLLKQPEYDPPKTTGFWVEPLPKEPSYETVIGGVPYLVIEVKSAIFPTRAGTLTIEPAILRCVVEEPDPRFGQDPFDRFRRGFFGLGTRGRDVVLRTEPVEIQALPLPVEGVPSGFEGAVGEFRMTMKADRTSVKQGDPVTLTMTVSGRGNINTASSPRLPEVPGVRSYDSGSRVNAAGSATGLEGEKVYERVVVPEVSGQFSLGPAEFSYFDPSRGRYRTLSAGPVEISVAPGPVAIGPRGELPERREVRILSQDILHIHTGESELRPKQDPPYRTPWFWAFQVLPLAAYLGSLAYRRHLDRLSADVGYARSRRADRMARHRLAGARSHLRDPDPLAFCSSLERAVRDFVGDKFNLPTAGMTYDQIERTLRSRVIPHSLIRDLCECLRSCEAARFCPTDLGPEERKSRLRNAEEVISRLGKH